MTRSRSGPPSATGAAYTPTARRPTLGLRWRRARFTDLPSRSRTGNVPETARSAATKSDYLGGHGS